MSNNIDLKVYECNIKIKKAEMLVLLENPRYKDAFNMKLDGTWVFCPSEGEIKGNTDDEYLVIDEFGLFGEGSGTAWMEILKDMLSKSEGTFHARLVWDGGEIERIKSINGVMTVEEVY